MDETIHALATLSLTPSPKMDIRFYRAEPDATLEMPEQSMADDPPFTVVTLSRTGDPDAHNHTGYDFFGAYGDGALIDAWAAEQPLDAITKADLPDGPMGIFTFPNPISEA